MIKECNSYPWQPLYCGKRAHFLIKHLPKYRRARAGLISPLIANHFDGAQFVLRFVIEFGQFSPLKLVVLDVLSAGNCPEALLHGFCTTAWNFTMVDCAGWTQDSAELSPFAGANGLPILSLRISLISL